MRCSIAAYVIVVAVSHFATGISQINCFKFLTFYREVLDIQGLNYVILTDPDGYISSPNYPLEYDDYVDYRWLIQAPEFNYRIIVYFMGNFTTKTGFDRLTVSLIYKGLI